MKRSKETNSEMPKKSGSKKAPKIIGSVLAIVAIGTAGYFGFNYLQEQNTLNSQIVEAKKMVLFNPLAKGKNSDKIRDIFGEPGKKISHEELMTKVKGVDFEGLIAGAKQEIDSESKKEMPLQEKLFAETTKKFDAAKKQSNFPKENIAKGTEITDLYKKFKDQGDAVGVNASVMSMQSLVGDTLTTIQKKTKEQVAREKEKKEKAARLAKAIADETYPSIGMLRGDLPNGAGIFGFFLSPDGPAENADLPTAEDGWGDDMAVVSLDGVPVKSAVIGNQSMENVLKTIELGKKVKVGFKDGSTKKVTLNLTHKDAKSITYPDLPDPGQDTDTDIDFGVSGYNIGQKHGNKEIGLVVTEIYSGSSVSKSKIRVGDIICRIDGYWVGDTPSISRIMSNYYDGDEVEVDYVTANGHLKTAKIELVE